MSVFESGDNQTTQNAFEALVGEGKKFSDPEALAKGKLEADNYIEQLKAQLEDLKVKAAAAETLEETLAKIAERNAQPPVPEPKPEANQPAKPAALSPEDLRKQIADMLAEKDQQATIANNVKEVTDRLVSVYGTPEAANDYVKKRAQELGVPLSWLEEVAAKSPKAFFETVRVEDPSPAARPTQGDRNVSALGHTPGQVKPNTYKWYQEIRKTNPTQYTKLTLQMHEDAKRLGEKFYE